MRHRKQTFVEQQQQVVEQVMGSVLDAIAAGAYQFLCELKDEVDRGKQRKQRKQKGVMPKERKSNIAPGVAICKHGTYQCPKCEEERKAKDARKNLPKS